MHIERINAHFAVSVAADCQVSDVSHTHLNAPTRKKQSKQFLFTHTLLYCLMNTILHTVPREGKYEGLYEATPLFTICSIPCRTCC